MVKAFRVSSKEEDITDKVEKKRDKGGGFLKKKPEEKLAYLRLLLFPGVFFEYQYLKKKGIMGGKTPHRSHAFFLTEPEIVWMPELSKEIKEKGLVDVNGGYHIPLDQREAETLTTTHFGLMKSRNTPETAVKVRGGHAPIVTTSIVGPGGVPYVSAAVVKQAMNLDAESVDDLQTPLQISVVYLPYWVAKFETPEATRYLVYGRDGKEDGEMTTQMNTNYDFVLDLERRAAEI